MHFFIDPEDGEINEAIKNPMEAAIPCKNGTQKRLELQETEATSDEFKRIQKTQHARTVEAHESTRRRLESPLPKYHEDRIAGKRYIPIGHFNLVHKFIPTLQAMKIPDAQAAVEYGRNLRKYPHGI